MSKRWKVLAMLAMLVMGFMPWAAAEGEGDRVTEMIVSDLAQLKTALESKDITDVYLADDITIAAEGIEVNVDKPRLLISGVNPDDPEGTVHTLTDCNSTRQVDTLTVRKSGTLKDITLENLNIVGKNYYGTLYILDEAKDVQVTYRSVTYKGPQLIYNRYGHSIIEDCDIKIGKYTFASPANEVGEVMDVTLKGTVSLIQEESVDHDIFQIATANGSITVAPGAQVFASAMGDCGFLNTGRTVHFKVESGGSFTFTGDRRFWRNSPFTDFTVEDGGRCSIAVTGNEVNSLLRVNGTLYVGNDSFFHLRKAGGKGYPALAFDKVMFDDPASVLLISDEFRVMGSLNSGGTIDIEAQQVNYWRTKGGGGIDDLPLSSWGTNNQDTVVISGALTQGTGGDWQTITSDWNAEKSNSVWDTQEPPDKANFSMLNCQVLALGRLELTAQYDAPKDGPAMVTGETGEWAELWLTYTEGDGGERRIQGEADGTGRFTLDISAAPPKSGTDYRLEAVWNRLFAGISRPAEAPVLRFEHVPDTLSFDHAYPSGERQWLKRQQTDWGITVYDSRGTGSQWGLYVQLLSPMTGGVPEAPELPSAILLRGEDGIAHELVAQGGIFAASRQTESDMETYTIRWGESQGFWLQVEPGAGYVGTSYTAQILWILSDTP